jgi:hypothetical protein
MVELVELVGMLGKSWASGIVEVFGTIGASGIVKTVGTVGMVELAGIMDQLGW